MSDASVVGAARNVVTSDGAADRIDDHGLTEDEASLVQRAVGGEQAAQEALLAWVRPLVVRYCRGKLGRMASSFHLADDVAQEVCVAVLRALPSYRDMGRPFMAFVYGIAAHKVADAQRREMRTPAPADELPQEADTALGPEDMAVQASEADRARSLLEYLPDHQREVVRLRVAAACSAEETGRILGMSAGAVRVAQHRAVQRLRAVASQGA